MEDRLFRLFYNCNIYTASGPIIENGKIFVARGKIKAVGKDIIAPEGTEQIDLGGCNLLPGFIDAHSHLGMHEECIGAVGDDTNEDTDPLTPHLRALDAINPLEEGFAEALAGGVTVVAAGPGSANVIGGTFAAIKTFGRCVDEMIIKEPVAMKCAFGENPKRVYGKEHKLPSTRMGTAALLRQALCDAQDYAKKKTLARASATLAPNPKAEALIQVLEKQIPLKVHAHRADDILTAIRIAKEFDINITIDHCTEGELIADILYREDFPVIIGPSLTSRSKVELANRSFKTAVILNKKGVKTALTMDHPVTPIQHLIVCAALAIREGMSQAEALKSITLYPAQILGIDNLVGSIEMDKDADFVIFNKDPFDVRSKVVATYIEGRKVYG
jgi:imidazolonepropionase-like amidohydrolase